MNGNTNFLTPILENIPAPPNTKIEAKCFTCQNFDICSIRSDYLQTAILIQRILGDPDENYTLTGQAPILLPGFIGVPIDDVSTLFPATITTTDNQEGTFYAAKFDTLDNVRCVYLFNEYYVMMTYTYNPDEEEYTLIKNEEVFYHITYILNQASLDNLQLAILSWREDEEENPAPAVINTTAFSSTLNCNYYDWIRGLSYVDGLKRIAAKYPNGIPLDEEGAHLYHIATYHYEPNGVPSYAPNGVSYLPLPYPIFIPPKVEGRPPTRRGDRNC